MKHLRKIAFLLLSAAFLAVLPTGSTLKVSAAQPTTHFVVYDKEDATWFCRVGGSSWDDSQPAEHWETYYLEYETFKDGDILVIQGEAPYEHRLELDLGNHRISNLTIKNNSEGIVVKAGSIDECYALGGSSSSITGTIANAYAYDDAAVTFCGDIATLNIIDSDVEIHASVSCEGTVGHLITKDVTGVRDEYYNIAKGRLDVSEGSFDTLPEYYGTTPAASAAPQSAPNAPAANAPNAYDKVPKTGDNSIPVPLLLAAIAMACFAGRTALKRR